MFQKWLTSRENDFFPILFTLSSVRKVRRWLDRESSTHNRLNWVWWTSNLHKNSSLDQKILLDIESRDDYIIVSGQLGCHQLITPIFPMPQSRRWVKWNRSMTTSILKEWDTLSLMMTLFPSARNVNPSSGTKAFGGVWSWTDYDF